MRNLDGINMLKKGQNLSKELLNRVKDDSSDSL